MSFFEYKTHIEKGDLVLAFINRTTIKPIYIKTGEILQTKYGHYLHDSMIGMPYGSQMSGAKGYGFIYLLFPTPEMWTLSLPHRTQIVYTPDSSYILQRLNVKPGSRVIEAGTGSASFTHAFARTVGLSGHVFTYEFHENRYIEAKKELELHGLVNTTIAYRDVCNDGLDIENLDIQGDVVFLDLPSPWSAIPHLNSVISSKKRVGICCFSPCIEQVTKTITALEENGWLNIEMVEVGALRWEARKRMKRSVSSAISRIKDIQERKKQGIESFKNGEKPQKLAKVDDEGFLSAKKSARVKEGDDGYEWLDVTKPESEIKSHTSYLTFAHKLN
ncbi:TRM61 [Candida oxycetoniae]|uniref:tRNA (adenine(58)-N(1))-methyltransferase catalytic subunit TRM61 n=1 Tax=Candida oxycetoniae TaxID=497107 RepID=A0AAI9T2E3_9ASCO|nr:TRM61 [Candida oxycetoniae]KAI3406915.1 TRM61 [Candida oxycetoniae]